MNIVQIDSNKKHLRNQPDRITEGNREFWEFLPFALVALILAIEGVGAVSEKAAVWYAVATILVAGVGWFRYALLSLFRYLHRYIQQKLGASS